MSFSLSSILTTDNAYPIFPQPTRMTQKILFFNLLLSGLDVVCVRQHLHHSDLITKSHEAGCSSSLLCGKEHSSTFLPRVWYRNNSVIYSIREDDGRLLTHVSQHYLTSKIQCGTSLIFITRFVSIIFSCSHPYKLICWAIGPCRRKQHSCQFKCTYSS
jgi:hypothetical protein